MTTEHAYDVARREFYALRQEEEIGRRVAREEARHVGAYFGKSRLQIGQDLEDKEYETWKLWAKGKVDTLEQGRNSAYADFGGSNSGFDTEAEEGLTEHEIQEEVVDQARG